MFSLNTCLKKKIYKRRKVKVKINGTVWGRESALKTVMGNTKILKAIIKSFVVDMPARIEALGAAINRKDIKQRCRLAH